MSAASHRSEKNDRPPPRRKAARISPELDEVLRMLKALEEQPEAESESDKPR
jgi:hypothetical protein